MIAFTGKTEGDLFVWIDRHLGRLSSGWCEVKKERHVQTCTAVCRGLESVQKLPKFLKEISETRTTRFSIMFLASEEVSRIRIHTPAIVLSRAGPTKSAVFGPRPHYTVCRGVLSDSGALDQTKYRRRS